jgi:putative peptidoglycan lipid II flippase
VLAFFALGSQILAVVRDRLLAHTFGAGSELDLYYAAFRVPDLLYVLFASVLSIYVLLPFVNRYVETDTVASGARVLSQMFTLFLYVYIVVAGVLAVTASWYIPYLFPGFVGQYAELSVLIQVLLLQPLLLGLSSLCGVVTQMNHRFILYALSPLLYNAGIILSIIFLYPQLGLIGLVLGVVIGALGHLAIQVPFVMRSDYVFSFVPRIDWSLIRKVLSVSVPRALTLSVNQIVLLVFTSLASLMVAGSVAVFQFGFNLQSVPLAIIGMSYSVAAFPTLSSLFAKSDRRGFNLQVITALRHIIFWSIPAIGLVVVLRAHIVRVLLGSGAFDWSDTRLTAAVLAVFVVSLVAQAALLLLIRAFYAGGRTFLPLVIAVGSAIVSVVTAAWFGVMYRASLDLQIFLQDMLRLRDVTGSEVLILPLAFAAGQFLQLGVLLIVSTSVFKINYRPLVRPLLQAFLAMFAGALSAYVTLAFVVGGVNQDTFIGILLQGVVGALVGCAAVLLAYYATDSQELHEIARSFKAKLLKTDVIAPQ